MAAFSAAERVGSRLNAWKTKPTFSPRKRVFLRWLRESRSSPKTRQSPLFWSRMPAMTEISVVFPQPDGPTSIISSPLSTSRSIPRRAMTCAEPLP
jgi:hypothetical protein